MTDQPHPEIEQLLAMVESAPDAMLMTDESGVILVVNHQVELMFGQAKKHLLGRSVDDLVPSRLRGIHSAHRTRYRVGPTTRSMGAGLDLWACRSDGTEFPVEVSLSPVSVHGTTRVIASVRDMTDRRAIDAQLHLIQASIDATHDGVFMFDPDSLRFTYVNQGAVNQTSYSREELLEMTPLHITPEFTRSTYLEMIEPLLDGRSVRRTAQTMHRTKNGTDIPVEISLEYPLAAHATDRRVLVAIARDITERKVIERDREREQLALQGIADIRTHLLNDGPIVEVFEIVCRYVAEICNADTTITRLDVENEQLRLVASWPGGVVDEHEQVPLDELSRSVIRSQKTAITRSAEAPPGLVGHQMRVPLLAGRDLVGILGVSRGAESGGFSDAEARLVGSFGQQSAAAIEIARVRGDRQRLRLLEDRERIGRDLHDLVIQRLFATGMGLQSLASWSLPPQAAEKIRASVAEIDTAISELRSAIFGLTHASSNRSVQDQVADAVEVFVESLGSVPRIQFSGDMGSIPAGVFEQLLPALQEALSNVARHANADAVSVSLEVNDSLLTLRVRDNGSGVTSTTEGGHGLENMARRAERLGGECTLTSATTPEHGATLTWTARL